MSWHDTLYGQTSLMVYIGITCDSNSHIPEQPRV